MTNTHSRHQPDINILVGKLLSLMWINENFQISTNWSNIVKKSGSKFLDNDARFLKGHTEKDYFQFIKDATEGFTHWDWIYI